MYLINTNKSEKSYLFHLNVFLVCIKMWNRLIPLFRVTIFTVGCVCVWHLCLSVSSSSTLHKDGAGGWLPVRAVGLCRVSDLGRVSLVPPRPSYALPDAPGRLWVARPVCPSKPTAASAAAGWHARCLRRPGPRVPAAVPAGCVSSGQESRQQPCALPVLSGARQLPRPAERWHGFSAQSQPRLGHRPPGHGRWVRRQGCERADAGRAPPPPPRGHG